MNQVYQEGRTVLGCSWHRISDKEVPTGDKDILLYNEVTGIIQLHQGFFEEGDNNWTLKWTHWTFIKIEPPISRGKEKEMAIKETERPLDDMKAVYVKRDEQDAALAGKMQKAKSAIDKLLAIAKREASGK